MKKYIKKSSYGLLIGLLSVFIVSCEKDFTNIGSNVISNTKFDTNSSNFEVTIKNSPLEKIQSDNISRQLGQYLLGIYSNPNYEKIEASIVSQVAIGSDLKINNYNTDPISEGDTLVYTIDTVFVKLPYQVKLNTTTNNTYVLDSVFGNLSTPFNLNIYRSNTYLNTFSPSDPSKINSFFSDEVFEKLGSPLNATLNYPFIPTEEDTIFVLKRRLSNNMVYKQDTIKYTTSTSNTIPIPFARIPLKKDVFKDLFLAKYGSADFASQEAFNDYFRGLIFEATGNDGSLISFDFNNASASLRPSIEVYYTNTVFNSSNEIVDTISRNDSFLMSGYKINTFKMEHKTYTSDTEVKIQGTAGSEAIINIFGEDIDNNGIPDQIDELRLKNLLVNDATLTLYINQSINPDFVPERLFLYKSDDTGGVQINSQIKDVISEAGFGGINGFLSRDSNGNKEKYVFKLTDYISDLLSGKINYFPSLKLKTYNPSDAPVSASDTIFKNFSWNPKAVTLFNESVLNDTTKATLKISYSEIKSN